MYTAFEELNLFIYHSSRGAFLDAVIWCLGPIIDESREYGIFRIYLAAATRSICRTVIRVED